MTKPQQKAFQDMVKGLLAKGKPILKEMASVFDSKPKKQSERFSRHLRNLNLEGKVSDFALKKAAKLVNENTVIAYDLTDIAKPHAKKMEKIDNIFDGSKREIEKGFLLHGVGINGFLIKLEIHDGKEDFLPQIRQKIVQEVSEKLNKKGIWVFDRGNDSRNFFKFLSQKEKLRFVARLRHNRCIADTKTGVIFKLQNMKCGSYEVFLVNDKGKPENSCKYRLVISSDSKTKQPIRLLTNLNSNFSTKKIVDTYLSRWGVESAFRRVKTHFALEKIRVLKYENLNNLVAIIQFVFNVLKILFDSATLQISCISSGILAFYKQFLKRNSLKKNEDSFFTFIKNIFAQMRIRKPIPPPNLPDFQTSIPFLNSS